MPVTDEVGYSTPDRPFELPPELIALKDLTREIVESECIPLEAEYLEAQRSRRALEEGRRHPYQGPLTHDQWAHLEKVSREAGIYDIHLPISYGGSGMGVLGRFVVEEELNRSVVTLPTARVPGIMFDCTPEQEREYLRPTIEGTKYSAYAQTEPGAGSDPGNSMRTRAVLVGDEWVINGTKTFISYAHRADYLLLLAVTDETKRQRGGITMFIVDTDTPGLSLTPVHKWFPGPDEQWTVHLDDVRVPEWKVLGEVGGGFRLGQQWLAVQDRLTRGSLACGILSRSLDLATEWVNERETFGRPLADRQAIQWMLVDILVDLKSIRALSYECAAAADRGEDVRVHAAISKLVGGNWGHRSIDKIMQIFGGSGESLDLPIPQWYCELRHGRIGGGTDEMQRMLIARGLIAGNRELWRA